MKQKSVYFLIFFSVLFIIRCTKKQDLKIDPSLSGYSIKLIQGNNQTDTIGKILKDQVIVKVTKDGDTLSKGYIRFETYNCDNLLQYIEYKISKNSSFNQVLIPYQWKLNCTVGKQYLTAILLDSLKIVKDSVSVTATGIQSDKGWYTSGSFALTSYSVTFSKLPSGRILTALNQSDYPYYSDDKGTSWHSLQTFPGKYNITKIIATPSNEVFLSVANTGIFYSKDGGQIWEIRNTGLPSSGFWGDIQYTKSGKLFVLTSNGVYTSADKGLSWHQAMQGLSYYAGFSNAYSKSDSSILAIHNNSLYRSITGGESWTPVYSISSTAGLSALFIDENDDIYVGVSAGIGLSYGLYVSKDNTQTWTKIYTPTPLSGFDQTLTEITKQNNSYYFYSTNQNILITTDDFITYTTINPPITNNNGRKSYKYIVPDINHPVVSTEFYGLYYFVP